MEKEIDRRSFLKTSAAIGAGLFVAAGTSSAAEKVDDINVALLGAGEQGKTLMQSTVRRIDGVRFKAVCDIWDYNRKYVSGRLRAYKHINNTYSDYKEMLDKEKDLDAVIIATPDFWHARHAIACLEAGLNVYSEKEMSNKLEDARKMAAAAKKSGKLLQIGHQRRSNPRYLHCYNRVLKEANLLGQITTINGQWNRGAKDFRGWPKGSDIDQKTLDDHGFESMQQFRNWRWYKGLGGGPIVDLGSHQIDIFSWFLGGNPKSVIASGGTDYYDKKTHQWYDTVMAIYEYETKLGTVRAFYQTLTTNSCNGYFETFMGDKGTLQISEAGGRGAAYPEKDSLGKWDGWVKSGILTTPVEKEKPKVEAVGDVRETPMPPSYGIPDSMGKMMYHQPHLQNFFDSIRGKAELNCPAKVGYETAVAVLKVNEAVEAGKKLEFKPEEFEI